MVYINHNGDFSDGCEETVYAYEMGAGETELQVTAFDLDETANHYSAGHYNGILESRTASSKDGFVKKDATGEPLWTAFLKSENNMLPADSSYTDGFIEIEVSDALEFYALGHFLRQQQHRPRFLFRLVLGRRAATANVLHRRWRL